MGRVAAGYAVVGWVLVEVADTVLPRLNAPDWTVAILVYLVVAGFPLAVTLAWFFDVVPDAAGARPAARARRWIAGAAVAGMVLFVGGLSLRFVPGLLRIDLPPRSVVVLPFENLSGDPAQEYLVAGVFDALISELGQVGALRVISRTSAMRYRDGTRSLADIARELDVDLVVEGSVARQGGNLQVRVSLIEPLPRERQLWGQEYRRRLQEALGMQGDIARTIAQTIGIQLTAGQALRLARAPVVDPATYEAYLRGMYDLNGFTDAGVQAALGHLNHAIELNPADPLAYAGLAAGYITIGHGLAATDEARHRARAAAERALRLDPELAEAHSALATALLYYEWDWDGAEAAFRRANALNRNLAMNHYHYAWYLALVDRMDEAIAAHRRAQELDPFEPLHTASSCARTTATGCWSWARRTPRSTGSTRPSPSTSGSRKLRRPYAGCSA